MHSSPMTLGVLSPLATCVCAGWTPGVRAAFLVDPVDGTTSTALQPGYPSAVEALRGQGKMLGIAGEGAA